MDEFRKSVNAVLYERLTSPLYGTFVFTWLVWNWKIPYVTFFISEDQLEITKIEYISNLVMNWSHVIALPLMSTAILVLIMPFISNGAYWVSIRFDKWKYDQKNKIEDKQMLSLEKSMELKKTMRELETYYSTELDKKDEEIKNLKSEIEVMQKDKDNAPKPNSDDILNEIDQNEFDDFSDEEFENLISNQIFKENIDIISNQIVKGDYLPTSNMDRKAMPYFLANGLVEKGSNNEYVFTEKGKEALKRHLN